MERFLFTLSILSILVWVVGMIFFEPGFLFHSLWLLAILFYILKMIRVEFSKKYPYLNKKK